MDKKDLAEEQLEKRLMKEVQRAQEAGFSDGELTLLLANVLLMKNRLQEIAAVRGKRGLGLSAEMLGFAVQNMHQAELAMTGLICGRVEQSPFEALSKGFADAAAAERDDVERNMAAREAEGANKH